MNGFIKTDTQEYKDRFISHLTSCGLAHELAVEEYYAFVEGGDLNETSNPELDAGECLSYWGD